MSSKPRSTAYHRFPPFSARLTKTQSIEIFVALFSMSVFFSITDLLTTSMALSRGLSEGNVFLVGLAAAAGSGVLGVLELTKAVFLAGCAAACVIGVKMVGRRAGYLALGLISTMVIIQAVVTLSNLSILV